MGYNWTPRSETYVNIQFKRTYLKCWNWSNENPCFLVDEVNIGFGLQESKILKFKQSQLNGWNCSNVNQ